MTKTFCRELVGGLKESVYRDQIEYIKANRQNQGEEKDRMKKNRILMHVLASF